MERGGGRVEAAAADPAFEVRDLRRGLVDPHRPGRRRRDRRDRRRPPLRCGCLGRAVPGVGRVRPAGEPGSNGPSPTGGHHRQHHRRDRFSKIGAKYSITEESWGAMHAVDAAALQEISTRMAIKMIETFDLDASCGPRYDDFATYIDTTMTRRRSRSAARKQKRTDLRLVGLGMVVTRNGGVLLVWHAYPGNRPDVTQFPALIDHLAGSYTGPWPPPPPRRQFASGPPGVGRGSGGADLGSMTVVFDAGQNSEANFTHLAGTGLHYVGSVPTLGLPRPVGAVRRRPRTGRCRPLPRGQRNRHPPGRPRPTTRRDLRPSRPLHTGGTP